MCVKVSLLFVARMIFFLCNDSDSDRSMIMDNKLIVIEGTDCSGKETQTRLLLDRLRNEGIIIDNFSFPFYDSPTGRIIGGPYLGKEHICEGWFSEGAANVDPYVAMCYFGADRRYHLPLLKEKLNSGHLLLDRYVYSNMAHQACKLDNKEERDKMIEKLDYFEFNLLELPRPDIAIFLYMPYEYGLKLKEGRSEKLDQHESSYENQTNSIKTYLELADRYDFIKVDCVKDGEIRDISDINDEIYNKVKKRILK